MSQQHIDLWKQAAEAFDQRYQALSADHMAASSPCSEWSIKELVDHTVGVQQGFTGGLVGAEIADGADWPAVKSAIDTALAAEGVLDGTTNHPAFGEVPKTMIFGIATSDLLIHSWDVARGAGLDETLPAEAVTACYMGLQKMGDSLAGGGMFAAAVPCADDADEQTKLLSLSGRQV